MVDDAYIPVDSCGHTWALEHDLRIERARINLKYLDYPERKRAISKWL